MKRDEMRLARMGRRCALALTLALVCGGCTEPLGERPKRLQDAMATLDTTPPMGQKDSGLESDSQGTNDSQGAYDSQGANDAVSGDATGTFADVPASHPFAEAIAWVAQQGIMKGCNPAEKQFCPDDPLTRAAAALTLIRMKFGDSFSYETTPYFSDVPASHWAFKHVQKMYDEEITSGCGGDLFCPEKSVSRVASAAFIIRAKFGDSFSYETTPYFNDVPASHWAFKYVQKMYDEEITNGCEDKLFCPDAELSRGAWAAFLYRVKTMTP